MQKVCYTWRNYLCTTLEYYSMYIKLVYIHMYIMRILYIYSYTAGYIVSYVIVITYIAIIYGENKY